MIEIGDSKVKDMRVGESVIYRDSDGWIPLTLPDSVTGFVMFKDNGNGQGLLTGSVNFKTSQTNIPVLNPPAGYEFTDWQGNYKGDSVPYKGVTIVQCDSPVGVFSGYVTSDVSTIFAAYARFKPNGGSIWLDSFITSVSFVSNFKTTLILNRKMVIKGTTEVGPVPVGIKKV